MKFHNRLTVVLLGVTSAALLASFSTVFLLVHRDELRDLDLSLHAQAKIVSHQTSLEGEARVPEQPTTYITRYAVLYDERGEPKTFTRAFGEQRPPSLAELGVEEPIDTEGVPVDIEVANRKLRGVLISTERGRLLYAVSRRSVDEDLRFLARSLAALFFGTLFVTALIARWLGRRLALDVNAIAGVARTVSTGDLRARVGPDAARGSDETRELARDLDGMVDRLEQLMSAQRTFISHAAHELRSPLATLRGELQLALRRERSAQEYRDSMQQALADVEELGQLTEDLLTLARIQQGPASGRSSAPIKVGALIADAAHMARGLAAAHRVTIAEPSGDALEVHVDGVRTDLARALRNLLDNAVTHSPEGTSVRVESRIGPESTVEIVVEDEGHGIEATDTEQIFTPFWRGTGEEVGDAGAGLGLAIAREIARQHGGDIVLAAQREGERGASFVLRLPRAEAGP